MRDLQSQVKTRIRQLGVDAKHKGTHLRAAVRKHFMFKAIEVAGNVAVRRVLTHAKDEEANSFYGHYGFVESQSTLQDVLET